MSLDLNPDRTMQKNWDESAVALLDRPPVADAAVPASLTIGNVRIAPATVLAPMAGVTDTVFRRFIKNASQFSPGTATADVDAADHQQPVRLRPDHDGVHLRRRPEPHARNQAQALPDVLRRRAPHLRPDLRVQPGNAGRLRAHLPGRRVRHRGPEPGLPGQARRQLQRRQSASCAICRTFRPSSKRSARQCHDSLHRQVPHGLDRQQHRVRAAGDAWRKTAA